MLFRMKTSSTRDWLKWKWLTKSSTDKNIETQQLSCDWKYNRVIPFHFGKRRLINNISSVQFSHSVVSDSLQPHELQHARPPCPSRTPGIHSNTRPSSQWCHPAYNIYNHILVHISKIIYQKFMPRYLPEKIERLF